MRVDDDASGLVSVPKTRCERRIVVDGCVCANEDSLFGGSLFVNEAFASIIC